VELFVHEDFNPLHMSLVYVVPSASFSKAQVVISAHAPVASAAV
jgi:hypothetical protein